VVEVGIVCSHIRDVDPIDLRKTGTWVYVCMTPEQIRVTITEMEKALKNRLKAVK